MAKYDWVKKIDITRFSPRERVMLLLTAIAVAVFLLLYIYLPAHRQVVALVQEQGQLDLEVSGLERQLEEVQKASERMKSLKKAGLAEPAEPLIMYRQSLSLVLEELNRLSRATAVDFLSVRPQPIEAKGNLQSHAVMIDLRSTFKGMGRYLQMLESLPRIVNIQNLKIEADPTEAAYVLGHLYLTVYLEQD